MEFQHAMFTRNGVRNLKEIKRGNQPKKHEHDDLAPEMEGGSNHGPAGEGIHQPVKKARHDYSAFKTDVERLQKNLDEFEHDLKQLRLIVRRKANYMSLSEAIEKTEDAREFADAALDRARAWGKQGRRGSIPDIFDAACATGSGEPR